MSNATPTPTVLTVHVKPGAKQTQLLSHEGNTLTLRLHAKPVEGAANTALLEFLSDYLALPKSALTLLRGQKSRIKQVQVAMSKPTGVTKAKRGAQGGPTI